MCSNIVDKLTISLLNQDLLIAFAEELKDVRQVYQTILIDLEALDDEVEEALESKNLRC